MAIAILGISLTALYSAAGGATRIVGTDENYIYAVELARSLLSNHHQVPLEGMQSQGETTGEFSWTVEAEPLEFENVRGLPPGRLQALEVTVSWRDGTRERSVALNSVVAGRTLDQ